MGQIVHDLADVHRRHAGAPPCASECPRQRDIAAVAGPCRHHVSLNPGARERQVPHDIRRLVPHELVRPAQCAAVHHTALVEHDRVRRGCALDQAPRLQLRDLVRKTERARRRELDGEALRRHLVGARLPADQGMRPLDRHSQAQHLRGGDDVGRILVRHRERRRDHQDRGLTADGGRLRSRERFKIRLDAAIEDGRLRPRQLDRQIVDRVRGDGGQHMLHRVDRGLAVPDRRPPVDGFDFREARGDFRLSRKIGPAEHDTLSRRGRQKRRFRGGTRVQSRPAHCRGPRDRAPRRQEEPRVWVARALRACRRSSPAGRGRPARAAARGAGARASRISLRPRECR